MTTDNRIFIKGLILMVSFTAVFILIFMPLFDNGKNGLEYLDNLYNSISKGSAYYIPELQEEAEPFSGTSVHMTLEMPSPDRADKTATILERSGAQVEVSGKNIRFTADLGALLDNQLEDADLMYHNEGVKVRDKYGMDERQVLYYWWTAAKLMDKALKKQAMFKEALVVTTIKKKGVETSYNYFGIEPQKISTKLGIVLFSLVFYVIYTIWYGFAIMFLFEGWGLRLEH